MSTMGEHFDEMTCLLFLEGQLEPERSREISAHVHECADCRMLLRSLERESVWLRESLESNEESVPAHLLEPPARAPAPWGWLMTLGFGSAGVYALWSGVIEPWQQRLSQAGFSEGNLLTMMFFSSALWKGWGEMRSLVEILASVSVAVIVALLLRQNWRRFTTVGLVMGALTLALGLPSPAQAGEFRHGEPNFTLPAGQTVSTDLFAAGDYIRIDGDVDGDVYAWGHSVTINGHVTGDVLAFSQEVRINGRVDGNVRSWSQTVSITGAVSKNVLAFCAEVTVDANGSVGGSITAATGDMELNGPVGRDILASAGSITMNSTVGGNVRVKSRDITVGPSADLHGQITYRGDRAPRIDSSAKVAGPVQAEFEQPVPAYKRPRFYWHVAFGWAAAFIFGIVLIALGPDFVGGIIAASDRPWFSCGVGFLVLLAVPVAAIIACITVVGLAVGISTLLMYAIALYSAQVFVGVWVGEKILGEGIKTSALIGRLALGLLILRLLGMIPWAGGWVRIVVILWGLGAIAVAAYKRFRPAIAAVTQAA